MVSQKYSGCICFNSILISDVQFVRKEHSLDLLDTEAIRRFLGSERELPR
ncbi:hypothetical protein LEP1GSC008_2508 [Leptospira kirschneri serovar Bulgarica str. Nikolaevo]|uniref:Uncharacterized protein n=1 Tax=Leptospira kirschneri serovar Bulgarica str. Nikolaevo TaxID=1240687 RepID=M6FB91_9LEPT|nr:hypothetical protein LEP1GSC008_2508 [Leptospira kirschneri serovar Bulgarica str. Nikolaevo]